MKFDTVWCQSTNLVVDLSRGHLWREDCWLGFLGGVLFTTVCRCFIFFWSGGWCVLSAQLDSWMHFLSCQGPIPKMIWGTYHDLPLNMVATCLWLLGIHPDLTTTGSIFQAGIWISVLWRAVTLQQRLVDKLCQKLRGKLSPKRWDDF